VLKHILKNSDEEQNRFAINSEMAIQISIQLRRIHEYYTGKSDDIKYIDAEYAITEDGQIIFTQTRPETVWSKGKSSLVAVDVEKAIGYPIILEGGITGSVGVVTGIVRVVRTVEEADENIKPGNIMIAPNTTNVWERAMGLAAGIITEIGGTGNHTAVVSREQGKPAIVGNANAIEILKQYENQEVTIDATSKRVFLGKILKEYLYHPDEIKPTYGGLNQETLEESWEEASKTGQTHVDENGVRWIGKPNTQVEKFMEKIFRRNHQWIANHIGLPIRDRTTEGIYQIHFSDIFQWLVEIREMDISQIEQFYRERVQTIEDYLRKSEELTLTRRAIEDWIDVFILQNAYMGFSYNIYKTTEGLFDEAIKNKGTQEPYFSQIRQGMSALIGETEATQKLRDYKRLLQTLQSDEGGGPLYDFLKIAVNQDDFNQVEKENPQFFNDLSNYATNYKHSKSVDTMFFSKLPLSTVAKELIKDFNGKRQIVINEPTSEEFYPDDEEFQRVARLALLSEKVRQDSHHIKVRGQWKFAEVLKPLAEYLIDKGVISEFEDMFKHEPKWLLDQVSRFEEEVKATIEQTSKVRLKPYLTIGLDRSNSAMLTSSPIAVSQQDVGGIDMNEIGVNRQGSGVNIQFDPVEIQAIIDMGITGFAPVIINLTPLPSILPLLGLAPKEEEYELSSLN